MAQKVQEYPMLPAEIESLVQQLLRVLPEYGFRLNRVLPIDGTEEADFLLLKDLDSTPTGAVKLKNLDQVIHVRNAADSAFSKVKGATPTVGDDLSTKQYVDDQIAATTVAFVGQCRLEKSGSDLLLKRWEGKYLPLKIGGVWKFKEIPSAGVTLSASGASADTTYFIYAFDSSGTLTLERSTTAHAIDSDTGIEVKSGDASRTLVGMARAITGPAWADTGTQRFVLSWFHRRGIGAVNGFSTDRTTTSTTYVEVNSEIRVEFLTWADEAVLAGISGIALNSGLALTITSLGFDGTTAEDAWSGGHSGAGGEAIPSALTLVRNGLAEGYHFATLLGRVGGGTGTWFGGSAVGARNTVTIGIRG